MLLGIRSFFYDKNMVKWKKSQSILLILVENKHIKKFFHTNTGIYWYNS